MSKTIDLMGFSGYDFEANSISAQKINVVQSMVVLDVFGNVKIGQDAGLFLTNGYNNITFGTNAGKYLTTGHDNIVLGTNAGYKINTSYENVIMGMDSAYNLTSGTRNCTYGYRCGYSMTTCGFNTLMGNYCGATIDVVGNDKNVMLGYECGRFADSVVESVYVGQRAGAFMNGASNVAVGLLAGAGDAGINIGAIQTVFVGFGAGTYLVDGIIDAVAIGTLAGEHMDVASYAVYVGSECGRYAKGDYNVYVGTTCGWDLSYSTNNTGIGYRCLINGGGNGYNVACGSECMINATTATRCVALGYGAARDATTAFDVVCLGTQSASGLTGGRNVVAIGTEALQYPSTNCLDQIAIGYRACYNCTGSTNIGIGTSSLGNESAEMGGEYNVCLGPYSAQNMTWGSYNVVAGYQACMNGGNTYASVIYGFEAMKEGEATRAVCVGYQAGYRNKGLNSIAIGTSALGNVSDDMTGNNNLAVGTYAGLGMTTGYSNCIFGNNAGAEMVRAHDCVAIGTNCNPNQYSGSDVVAIGTNVMAREDDQGNARSADSTHIQFKTGASSVDDYYTGLYVVTLSGTGEAQARYISAYVGSTQTATVSAWTTIPDTSTVYTLSTLLDSGQCQAGSTINTIVLRVGSNSLDDGVSGAYCLLVGGTGSGQIRFITSYVGATKVATVTQNWTTIPDNTTLYQLYPVYVTGRNVIAIGTNSARRLTSNRDSIYMGTNSGYFGGGYENIAIGVHSLYSLCAEAPHNVCIGKWTATGLKNGETNTIVGYQAGREMGESAFIGHLPPEVTIDTTSGNVLVGYSAGYYIRGPMNTCIGNSAGTAITLGIGLTESAGNIIIGYHGDFYRSDTSRAGIYTKASGNLVIGNAVSPVPPIILGTVPYIDPSHFFPDQTSTFTINCLNADGLTSGEITFVGLVGKVGGTLPLTATPPAVPLLTAAQLRNHVIIVTNYHPITFNTAITLPTYNDIAATFPNPYNLSPWPYPGYHFDITIMYVAGGNGLLTINGNTGVSFPVPTNAFVPCTTPNFARTLKLYVTASSTINAMII